PLRGIARVDAAHRVAQPVEALRIEDRLRERVVPEVARGDVRAPPARLELLCHWSQLELQARDGKAQKAGPGAGAGGAEREGRGLGGAHAGHPEQLLAAALDRQFLELVENRSEERR